MHKWLNNKVLILHRNKTIVNDDEKTCKIETKIEYQTGIVRRATYLGISNLDRFKEKKHLGNMPELYPFRKNQMRHNMKNANIQDTNGGIESDISRKFHIYSNCTGCTSPAIFEILKTLRLELHTMLAFCDEYICHPICTVYEILWK